MKHPNKEISKCENTGRTIVRTINTLPTLTQQQFKDECDVNNIVRKFDNTGEFTHRTSKIGQYADFSQIQDFHQMVNEVQYAEEAFSALPAKLRSRFKNNPGDLLTFLQDSNNLDEAIELGLIDPSKALHNDTTQPINNTKNTTNPTNPTPKKTSKTLNKTPPPSSSSDE